MRKADIMEKRELIQLLKKNEIEINNLWRSL